MKNRSWEKRGAWKSKFIYLPGKWPSLPIRLGRFTILRLRTSNIIGYALFHLHPVWSERKTIRTTIERTATSFARGSKFSLVRLPGFSVNNVMENAFFPGQISERMSAMGTRNKSKHAISKISFHFFLSFFASTAMNWAQDIIKLTRGKTNDASKSAWKSVWLTANYLVDHSEIIFSGRTRALLRWLLKNKPKFSLSKSFGCIDRSLKILKI